MTVLSHRCSGYWRIASGRQGIVQCWNRANKRFQNSPSNICWLKSSNICGYFIPVYHKQNWIVLHPYFFAFFAPLLLGFPFRISPSNKASAFQASTTLTWQDVTTPKMSEYWFPAHLKHKLWETKQENFKLSKKIPTSNIISQDKTKIPWIHKTCCSLPPKKVPKFLALRCSPWHQRRCGSAAAPWLQAFWRAASPNRSPWWSWERVIGGSLVGHGGSLVGRWWVWWVGDLVSLTKKWRFDENEDDDAQLSGSMTSWLVWFLMAFSGLFAKRFAS